MHLDEAAPQSHRCLSTTTRSRSVVTSCGFTKTTDDGSWPRLELVLRSESGREVLVLDEIHALMNRDASQDDWFAYFGLIDESLRNAYADLARTETQSDE